MNIKHHFGYDSQFEINLGVCNALKNYNIITLPDFNFLFQKNDINVLADIFLNLTPDFNGLMYEYDRISEVFSNNWAQKETLEENGFDYKNILIMGYGKSGIAVEEILKKIVCERNKIEKI